MFEWKEIKGKEGEGFGGMRIPCLDNKIRGKRFGGIGWVIVIKVSIFPKLERFEVKTLLSFPLPSLPFPLKQTKIASLPFLFSSLPFVSFLSKVVIQT